MIIPCRHRHEFLITMSQRIQRVSELIQRELGAIIAKEIEFNGPLVSVHGVEISTDFRDCVVFVGILGASKDAAHDEEKVLNLLQRKRAMLQKRLSKRVVLRNTPVLQFRSDDSIERGVRTLNALQEVEDLRAVDSKDEDPTSK